MSIAGVLPPICDYIDGHLLLDGCYTNNVPGKNSKEIYENIFRKQKKKFFFSSNKFWHFFFSFLKLKNFTRFYFKFYFVHVIVLF